MKRVGALLVFKPDTSRAEAAMILNQIREYLELPESVPQALPFVQKKLDAGETVPFNPDEWYERSFRMSDIVHEFNDDLGRPVWYIP